jgi:3-hydroxyisobutyrate dehydrogenase/2-hydroxy-3-oxopropionate reductase
VDVGFAGLGRMGAAMARRVLHAGFPLTVWNRSAAKADGLVAAGARRALTPRDLAAAADVVVTMLADADALDAVLRGDDGVLAGLRPDAVVVDMSTIGPTAAAACAAAVAERGARWLDAPVSGSVALAQQGTLTIMAGGAAEALDRARPVLESMGQKILHLGPETAGAAMKLVINSMLAVINEAVAEGLVLAERSGIERETAYDVFAGGVVAAPYVLYKRDAFVRPDETPVAFTIDLMRKDLRLAFAVAEELGVPLAAVRAADEVLAQAEEQGLGTADFARVADVIRARRA